MQRKSPDSKFIEDLKFGLKTREEARPATCQVRDPTLLNLTNPLRLHFGIKLTELQGQGDKGIYK